MHVSPTGEAFTVLMYEMFRLCIRFSQILFNSVILCEHGKARENQFFSSEGNFVLNYCNHYVQHVCSKCVFCFRLSKL